MPEFLLVLPAGRTPTAAELAAHRRWLAVQVARAHSRVRRHGDAAWVVYALDRAKTRLADFDEYPDAPPRCDVSTGHG